MSGKFISSLFFVFGKIIDSTTEEFSVETEVYNEQLKTDWFAFWIAKGEEIVNSSWSHKYSKYLLKEEEEEENPEESSDAQSPQKEETKTERIKHLSINIEEEADKLQKRTEDATNLLKENLENHKEQPLLEKKTQGFPWQQLWDEHYTAVISRTYQLFAIAYYNQYCFYTRNIEDLFEDVNNEKEKIKFIDERAQLKALGLPTSFFGNNKKYHKSRQYDSCSEHEEEQTDQRELPESSSGRSHSTGSESMSDNEDLEMSPTEKQTTNKQKKKRKNRKLRRIPKVILENRSLRAYWQKRFSLFSRFDEGIQLDQESWFSVTPEKVAIHMAERLRCDTIIDAFCGSGGNAIQFAFTCSKVIAIDIDAEKIKNARHNAIIYGVANKIEFIIGDYLQLCDSLKGDVVFLSPPWGGPKYMSKKEYDIEESLSPMGASALAEKSRQISENIAFFLPRNSIPKQLAKLAGVGKRVEIEHNYLDTRLVGLTAIYGDWLIDKKNLNVK